MKPSARGAFLLSVALALPARAEESQPSHRSVPAHVKGMIALGDRARLPRDRRSPVLRTRR